MIHETILDKNICLIFRFNSISVFMHIIKHLLSCHWREFSVELFCNKKLYITSMRIPGFQPSSFFIISIWPLMARIWTTETQKNLFYPCFYNLEIIWIARLCWIRWPHFLNLKILYGLGNMKQIKVFHMLWYSERLKPQIQRSSYGQFPTLDLMNVKDL